MTEVRAEITANVWQVRTEVGAAVAEGDELVVLELRVAPEDNVQEGDVLAVLDP
jgi:biotin carboxyl carrier protein